MKPADGRVEAPQGDARASGEAALVEAALGAPAAIFQLRLDPSGTFFIPFASPDFVARYEIGRGTPEETASSFISKIHRDDLNPLNDALARSARTLEPFQSEFRFALPTGTEVWLEARANPVRTADGGIVWNGITADVTARKAAEAALRGRERQFRAVLDTLQDTYFRTNADGLFVLLSPSAAGMYGYDSADELIGQPSRVLFWDPDERERLIAEIREKGFVRDRVGPGRRKDGSLLWTSLNAQPWLDADGRPAGFEGVVRDISERMAAEAALRERESILEQAQSIARTGSWRADFRRKNLEVSPEFAHLIGREARPLRPDEVFEIIHPEDRPRVRAAWAAAQAGAGYDVEHRVIVKGETRWLHVRGQLEFGADGRPVRAVGVSQDVTERVSLEESLRQAQKMEAVGRLAGGVAHDFNNMLTVISGNTELLVSGTPADDPRQGLLKDIAAATERAATLTGQLLAFSRRQILEPRLVDLNAVLEGLERMLRRLITENIELATDLEPGPLWVKVDVGQIEQVVLNLAVNARDAMPSGGRLTIRTRGPSAGGPEGGLAGGRRGRRDVTLSITDTGTGMPPEVLAHVFEPFFTTKAAGRGTGLGLATVYGIVKQSGGDVTAESEPGKGSTFAVFLPSQPPPPRRETSSTVLSGLAGGTETVLVVEDEATVRRIVRTSLEAAGYRVLEARSGPEALETARRHSGEFHLAITDVVMPEMSGREVAERLRLEHPGLRVLFMSGYTDDETVRHGIGDSGVAFLQKPFSPRALARKVREVLDGEPGPEADAPRGDP